VHQHIVATGNRTPAPFTCISAIISANLYSSFLVYLSLSHLALKIAGGGVMTTLQDPPPPAAADAAWHELQTQLAVENLSVASSQLLDLIRTLRLSLLLMDEETILAEEEYQVLSEQQVAQEAKLEAQKLEEEWRKRRNEL
jgi:hypothetical protein